MKARTLVAICLISGLAAVAQTAPPSQKVAPDTAKKSPMTAKPMAAPAKPAATPAKPVATQPKPAAPQNTAKPTNAAAKAPVKQAKATTKRDPFVSPVREGNDPRMDCVVGKKCLAIDTIQLKGIVRAQTGSIAVVESSTRKVTYFLRESDPVFNGYVVKITGDSVMFRENVMDRAGKQNTREIVKRVSAPPV